MKKILIALPVLLIIIVVAVGFSLNSIIKSGIETLGSAAMGAPVSLDSADISLFSGKGKLKGLVIGNPKGFKTEKAFSLREIRVGLDVQSILSEKILIDEIFIDSPDITYEKGGKGDNIKTLMSNVENFAGTAKGKTGDTAADKPDAAQKKMQISDFIVRNGKVNVSVGVLTAKPMTLDLPEIHLKDIGKKGQGATVSDVLAQVFAKVDTNIFSTVTGSLKDVRGMVEKEVGKAVGDNVGGALDKVKGLFGK